MKKFIWILTIAASVIAFASCSKKDSQPSTPGGVNNGGNAIAVKIDGTQKNFTNAKAQSEEQDNVHQLIIAGSIGSEETGEVLGFTMVKDDGAFTAGEYLEGEHEHYQIVGVYFPKANEENGYAAGARVASDLPLKVTITSISATRVKGTFSGAFYDANGTGENKKMFTEGSFDVPLN